MATMNTVIERVDGLKPNAYTDEDKYRWINQLEGIISVQVMDATAPEYSLPDDADIPLLVGHPFDDIYELYVSAMVDYHNREYNNYNNAALMFQERLDQFKAWYIRKHPSSKARNFRNVMG